MFRILITEPKYYSKQAIDILKEVGEVILLENPHLFGKLLSNIDILVIKLNFIIDRKVMEKGPKLKIIATSTTGLNHIDLDFAKERGIEIISLRGQKDFLQNVRSTAEQTLTLLLSLVRKTPWAFDSIKRQEWNREKYYGNEIFGKTIGILGFGRLGEIVASYANSLGLKVLAHDPYVDNESISAKNVTPVSFENLFKLSDFVSIHVLLTPETEKMVGAKELKLMKPTAVLINTARGEIVDEEALLAALETKQIAGAALDVIAGEKPDGSHLTNNALIEYAKNNENLLIVPHLGGATYEAMSMTEEFIANKIKGFVSENL